MKAAEEGADYAATPRSAAEISKRIAQLEEQMYRHARDLEFESAAQVRDQIHQLREQLVKV
ncbi:MAG: hypothetical protein B7Z23_13045 [Pseudomonadales bacterium 32-61-5]|nr:MAG: hypothetical protein B7Z23_13045 [Pseudomonadales bacterium 32-61-5]